jgi:RHS repeat-associated protein
LGADRLYSRTTGSGTSSYLTNLLGSTIALANGSGEVKTSYTYDPFGETTTTGEASGNPFQYTGRENDGAGLQYNRARYYSPAQGRFISRDPAGFAGSGSNLYRYVGDDPLDFTDPSGEDGVPVPNPTEIKRGLEEGISKIGGTIKDAIDGGGHAIEEGGKYAIEHPGTTAELGAGGTCIVVSGGWCLVAVAAGGGVATWENAEDVQCGNFLTSGTFWIREGGTVGGTLVGGAPGLLPAGMEAGGVFGNATSGLSRAGRAALNTPPSLASGATSTIVEPGLHEQLGPPSPGGSSATSSC